MKNITKYVLTLLLTMPLALKAESYVAVEANVGQELSINSDHWEGEYPVELRVSYVKSLDKHIYFTTGYSHISNLANGSLINGGYESVLDRVFMGIGVKFNIE